jgi:hypothetical protein
METGFQVIRFDDGEYLGLDQSSGGYGYSTDSLKFAHILSIEQMQEFVSTYMAKYGHGAEYAMAQIDKPYKVMDITLNEVTCPSV